VAGIDGWSCPSGKPSTYIVSLVIIVLTPNTKGLKCSILSLKTKFERGHLIEGLKLDWEGLRLCRAVRTARSTLTLLSDSGEVQPSTVRGRPVS